MGECSKTSSVGAVCTRSVSDAGWLAPTGRHMCLRNCTCSRAIWALALGLAGTRVGAPGQLYCPYRAWLAVSRGLNAAKRCCNTPTARSATCVMRHVTCRSCYEHPQPGSAISLTRRFGRCSGSCYAICHSARFHSRRAPAACLQLASSSPQLWCRACPYAARSYVSAEESSQIVGGGQWWTCCMQQRISGCSIVPS